MDELCKHDLPWKSCIDCQPKPKRQQPSFQGGFPGVEPESPVFTANYDGWCPECEEEIVSFKDRIYRNSVGQYVHKDC